MKHRSFRWAGSCQRCGREQPQTGSGRSSHPGLGVGRVAQRCADARRHISGWPKPPFTPGYELVGVIAELGRCSRSQVGDRVGALTQWGANAESVGSRAIRGSRARRHRSRRGPEPRLHLHDRLPDASPRGEGGARRDGPRAWRGRQGWHRGPRAGGGGRTARLRNSSADDRAAVERLGAVAIDYQHEDFLARVRELTGDGVDIALDPFGGPMALRSFRALRPGGRLVIYGRQNTIVRGMRFRPEYSSGTGEPHSSRYRGLLSARRRVRAYRIQKMRIPHQDWYRRGKPRALLQLLRDGKIHPVVAERLPLSDARRAHELLEERRAATGKLVLVS